MCDEFLIHDYGDDADAKIVPVKKSISQLDTIKRLCSMGSKIYMSNILNVDKRDFINFYFNLN